MSQPITLNRYVCFLVTLFFIWFFPGYYLLTHEAGHCLSAKQLGSHQQQLYLACSGEKKPLYTLQPANSMTIFICKPYFYRFFMQEGGCSYSWEQQGSPFSQKIQRTWFLVAGSIYGLVASYLLAILLGLFGYLYLVLHYKHVQVKWLDIKKIACYPFQLYRLIQNLPADPIGKKSLLWTSCLGYLLHVDRLFYGLLPGATDPLMPPLFHVMTSDGTAAWANFLNNKTALISIAWCAWILKLFFRWKFIRHALTIHRHIVTLRQ